MIQPHSDQQLVELLERWAPNVGLFIHEAFDFPNEEESALGVDIYPWQQELDRQYDARSPRLAVRSGNGVGKTTKLAWLMWHHLLCRFPQKTAVTAPTEKQLFDALWSEFKSWGNRLPKLLRDRIEIKSDRAELRARPEESFVSIKTARVEQPEALQGIYSPGYVLLIGDEASGVPDAVFQAAQGSMAGGNVVMILTGNPIRDQGFFYDIHMHQADTWWTKCVPVGPQNEPRKGAAQAFAKQIAESWGENSNEYRTRVLGEFPISDDMAIIPRDLVDAALTRDVQTPLTAPIVWGVDVARQGADRSAIAKRQQQVLLEPLRTFHKLDTMQVAGWVKLEWDQTPGNMRPIAICVDAIGFGAGVADRLTQLGLPARAINVSESPAFDDGTFADLRTELWFKMRGWFARRDCKIPALYQAVRNEDNLIDELTGVHYTYRKPSNKLTVENKDVTKKRLRRSPDLADALMLTFCVDALTLAGAGRMRSGPLNRAVGNLV